MSRLLISGPKKNPKAKKLHEQRQIIFRTIRGGYRSLAIKTRVLRQIAPESSPESFVAKVLWGTFSVLDVLGRFGFSRKWLLHSPPPPKLSRSEASVSIDISCSSGHGTRVSQRTAAAAADKRQKQP